MCENSKRFNDDVHLQLNPKSSVNCVLVKVPENILIPNESGHGEPTVRCRCGGEPQITDQRDDAVAMRCPQCGSYGPRKLRSGYGLGVTRVAKTSWNFLRLLDVLGLKTFPPK